MHWNMTVVGTKMPFIPELSEVPLWSSS